MPPLSEQAGFQTEVDASCIPLTDALSVTLSLQGFTSTPYHAAMTACSSYVVCCWQTLLMVPCLALMDLMRACACTTTALSYVRQCKCPLAGTCIRQQSQAMAKYPWACVVPTTLHAVISPMSMPCAHGLQAVVQGVRPCQTCLYKAYVLL
jgi:hypothetical protein